eukprot:5240-Heterococcus_DN1.PRE.1
MCLQSAVVYCAASGAADATIDNVCNGNAPDQTCVNEKCSCPPGFVFVTTGGTSGVTTPGNGFCAPACGEVTTAAGTLPFYCGNEATCSANNECECRSGGEYTRCAAPEPGFNYVSGYCSESLESCYIPHTAFIMLSEVVVAFNF